jgi:purine-nucleoside phosphorylase
VSATTSTARSALRAQIDEATAAIRQVTTAEPSVGVILGTGLGQVAEALHVDATIPYGRIPHFRTSTVESHVGELVFGRLTGAGDDHHVVVMRGRMHYYEGYTMKEVTFPVRVMRALGVNTLLVSNAVGGMNPLFAPGDIVAVTDHINLMGDNPLIGPNDDSLGPRFPDMSEPYDTCLLDMLGEIALEERIHLQRGVFVAVAGPNLETAAEYRFLRAIGADVVGMSLVPENIVAVHSGMRVAALAVVTDRCLPDALEPASVEAIIQVAQSAEPRLTRLFTRLIERL